MLYDGIKGNVTAEGFADHIDKAEKFWWAFHGSKAA
mgnify:CR=1 FL=1